MREFLSGDPLEVLARWVAEAAAAELPTPAAMTLATVGSDGTPQARTVLVTAIDPDGGSLRFHSSTPTRKTVDLAVNPAVCGVFHWPVLGRQVVLSGTAEERDAAISRAAFVSRPRPLRLIAWAYDELTPTLQGPDRAVRPGAVESAVAAAFERDPNVSLMPASWTTIDLLPSRVDMWQGGDETTPPARTRFARSATGWRSFPVLP